MKKQMTVLGVLGILTCLSFTNAQAQVFVDVIVAAPVCRPKVVYQQPPSCNQGHYNYQRGHHHHHGNNPHYRQQCCVNNNGRGHYHGNGRGYGHHR